ncbi:MAG: C39 family peptidase [Bacilli bacterium]
MKRWIAIISISTLLYGCSDNVTQLLINESESDRVGGFLRSVDSLRYMGIPEEVRIENVPHIIQLPELPRGCEVTALAILLAANGIEVDKMTLADEIPKVPYREGEVYGNLNEGFSGDMYSFKTNGLGVYVGPILQLASNYTNNVENLTGKSFDRLLKHVSEDEPVWVLTNATFAELPEDKFLYWDTNQGTMRVTRSMHAVVIVGYTPDEIIIQDPLHETGYRYVNREDFQAAWVQMGRQAMTIDR